LDGFQVLCDGVEPDFSPVLIGFNLMKNWSPDGHLATAMGGWGRLFAFDDVLDVLLRKPPTISLRDQRQVLE
jgi:hypothetical protein